MAQYELNEALARAGVKKGEVRNPTGRSGNPLQYLRNRDIKQLIKDGGDQPCEQPGYEHLTNFQYLFGIHIWDMAKAGSRFAITLIANRVWGRVPLDVEVTATQKVDYTAMTDDELRERAESLLRLLREPETVDAEIVKPDALG